jgi:membrane protease YdiL (CAAX protease family)
MEFTLPGDKLGLALKVGLYVFIAIAGLMLFPMALQVGGYLIASAMGTFAAAATANVLAVRIFERGRLADIGMNWTAGSLRNLGLGVAGGIGAACAVLVLPLAFRLANLEAVPGQPGSWSSLLFITILLMFGAVGEEMLFHGYAFQLLVGGVGRFATILPVSVLFGLAHQANQNVTPLGVINTIGFGIVLGYAFVRSGDLWLPIGIHFGWNWTLPLFGVNLSGFTMGVTGFAMHWKVSDFWSGGAYGPEGGALTCGVLIALLFYLYKAPVEKQDAFLMRSLPEG